MEKTDNYFKLIPQVLDKNIKVLDAMNRRDEVYAKILQQKQQAEIPQEELEKIAQVVAQTPCKEPDPEILSKHIALKVISGVQNDIQKAVEEKIKTMKINLTHNHYHSKLFNICEMVEKDVRNWLITLVVLCFTLAASLTGCLWWYFTSDIYYGQQYQQIYSSKYITTEEKNMLAKEIRGTGFLPNEYYDVPKVCQGRIKRNKQLIKERREQAEVNKGRFNTIPAIER